MAVKITSDRCGQCGRADCVKHGWHRPKLFGGWLCVLACGRRTHNRQRVCVACLQEKARE